MYITRYEDTKFVNRLLEYGIGRLFSSCDFILSLIFTLTLLLLFILRLVKFEVISALAPSYLAIALALFGIIIAGQAIVVSSLEKDFVRIMRKAQSFDNIMFKFYFIALIILCSIIITIFLNVVLNLHYTLPNLIIAIFLLNSLLFLYGMISSILLVGTIMRYAIYKADFMLRNEDDKTSN
jgi:hypothetical protein